MGARVYTYRCNFKRIHNNNLDVKEEFVGILIAKQQHVLLDLRGWYLRPDLLVSEHKVLCASTNCMFLTVLVVTLITFLWIFLEKVFNKLVRIQLFQSQVRIGVLQMIQYTPCAEACFFFFFFFETEGQPGQPCAEACGLAHTPNLLYDNKLCQTVMQLLKRFVETSDKMRSN